MIITDKYFNKEPGASPALFILLIPRPANIFTYFFTGLVVRRKSALPASLYPYQFFEMK